MNKILLVFAFIFSLTFISARELEEITAVKSAQIERIGNDDVSFDLPHIIFSHTNTRILVKFKDAKNPKLISNNYKLNFIVNHTDQLVEFDKNGVGTISYVFTSNNKFSVLFENVAFSGEMPVISIWYMLLPLAGLLLFLFYKLAFSKKSLHVSTKDVTERKISFTKKSKLRLIRSKEVEEEEVLV